MSKWRRRRNVIAVRLLYHSNCGGGALVHVGLLHPNGVDVAGYSTEKRIGDKVYRFYNFGFPSLAAVGLSYYGDYQGNGLTGTVGVGIGSVIYGSLAYQWRLEEIDYLKLGAGLTAGVAYSGVYPVLAYEHRF